MKKEQLKLSSWVLFLIGCSIAFFINQLIPQGRVITSYSVFIGGFFAIFAMMLPGVSGSFLLLVLGLYQHIITSLKNPLEIESIKTILIFGSGAVLGLVIGSRLLKKLLDVYRHETLMILLGFMLGSCPKLWPWQSSVFTLRAYDLSVIAVTISSFFLFLYLTRIADLKESKSRNKIGS